MFNRLIAKFKRLIDCTCVGFIVVALGIPRPAADGQRRHQHLQAELQGLAESASCSGRLQFVVFARRGAALQAAHPRGFGRCESLLPSQRIHLPQPQRPANKGLLPLARMQTTDQRRPLEMGRSDRHQSMLEVVMADTSSSQRNRGMPVFRFVDHEF